MYKRKFTVVTQLHEENNKGIIDYIDFSRSQYSKAVRESFHIIKNTINFDKSMYNTYLQNKYGITKRTANSIISDAQGSLNIIRGLKFYEKVQLERKIGYLETKVIPKLCKKRDENSSMLRLGLSVSLISQRNLRRKIVAKKQRLNRLKHKLANLNYQLETSRFKFCFGTKYLL